MFAKRIPCVKELVVNLQAVCMILLMFVFISCGGESSVDPGNDNGDTNIVLELVESEDENFRVVRLLSGLQHPWAVAWLPDDRILITERQGHLNLVDGDDVIRLSGLPDIQSQNQGGLLDVAVHPDYENNGWIYFTFSEPGQGGTGTALARAQLGASELTDVEVLYSQEPKRNPGRHYGSRIAFPDDGTVVFTIGDRGLEDPSQDLSDPTGSTIRLNGDGSIPNDNPFTGTDDYLPEIYSYGHRNAQGMAIHPETGEIWQNEHGPRGGDELNIIQAGGNYGWPVATYGTEYSDGSPIGIEPHEDEEIVNPVTYWSPTSIAPSGMTFYTGDRFSGWQGDIFIGALAERHLLRIVVEGDEVIRQEELLRDDLGRIRDVRTGPDGYIYLLTDESNGSLYRLEPVE